MLILTLSFETLIILIGQNYNSTLVKAHAIYLIILILRIKTRKPPLSLLPPTLPHLSFCQICKNSKPPRYSHCRRCQRCYFKRDHHCRWLQTCIAFHNGNEYVHILLNLLLQICEIYWVLWGNWYFFLVMGFLSGFIAWECYKLLQQYIEGIKLNQTLIQSYKGVRGAFLPAYLILEQMCNKNMWKWMIPIATTQFSDINLLQPVFKSEDQHHQNENIEHQL